MKRISLLLACALSAFIVTAQNVGIGTKFPNASAILDISSTNKGLLVPRMNAAQRTAISSPAAGLLVYQTESPVGFYYNHGTAALPNWIQLAAVGSQASGIKGYYDAGTTAYPTSTLSFITSPVTVTITAGQSVFITASRALGGYAAANELGIYPAYQSVVPGSPIVNLDLGMFGLQVPANTRVTFSVNGVFENLPAGTYRFGMSGVTSSPNWTNSEWGYTSLLVY